MNIINGVRNYILDNEYKLVYYNQNVNIVNYLEIKEFSSTKIVIKHSKGINIIYGSSLVISKMLDDEILITGAINNIEFG